RERLFHCRWCDRDFPKEDGEETEYAGQSYCRECYGYKKEAEDGYILLPARPSSKQWNYFFNKSLKTKKKLSS
ncbi:MAG: hypothetical protein LBJ72_08400, partial [Dysgonamonadaceae bacterium]|nr:hypothetical protein [Dysgonamonadaceae bacterium]